MSRRSIVTVHGVGNPKQGSVVAEFHRALKGVGIGSGYREDLIVDGTVYPRFVLNDGKVAEIIEVNWSDVQRPPKTPLGIIQHVISILASFLNLSAERFAHSGKPATLAKWYRVAFETVLVWCLYPPIVLLFLWTYENPMQQISIVVIATIAMVILTLYLKRFSRLFSAGYAWPLILAIVSLAHVTCIVSDTQLLKLSSYGYSLGQSATAVLGLLAVLEALVKRARGQRDYLLTRLAFLYVPFIMVSAIGAIIWSLSLYSAGALGGNSGRYKLWGNILLETLNYDLSLMEYVFASAVAIIGLLALVGVAKYVRSRSATGTRLRPGLVAQNWISRLLVWNPLILSIVSVCFLASAVFSEAQGGNTLDVLHVYTLSAMRALPFLPFVWGPLAILVDILGDITFYLLPSNTVLGISKETKERLRSVLEAVHEQTPDNTIVVVSHSQGSVIAIDLLGETPELECRLITLGSPIESLYSRFLFSTPNTRNDNFCSPNKWVNIYRGDDYVAGPIESWKVRNIEMENGGHTGYWRESYVAREVINI